MEMTDWRLLGLSEESGAMQMALDEAILSARAEGRVPNTLRFYTWRPPAVTVGFFQSVAKEIDLAKAGELGVDVVRRLTGGGAVLHDRELTYSLFASEGDVPGDILQSYEFLCGGVVAGLASIGFDARFKPINDILIGERKVSGNAQTRKRGVVLQHGTILLDVDVKRMFSVLRVPDEKIRDKMIKSAGERVTSLRAASGREFTPAQVRSAMVEGFEQALGIKPAPGVLTRDEIAMAKMLHYEKYSTREWNFMR